MKAVIQARAYCCISSTAAADILKCSYNRKLAMISFNE